MIEKANPGEWRQLEGLIRDVRIALLTTSDRDGRFHTRPVQTMEVDTNHALWFFTDWTSPKADELNHDIRLSLGYADPAKRVYAAISGTGRLIRDAGKAKELWSLDQRAYYPDGPGDERLALLQVRIERAEYWLAPGRVSYLIAALAAVATGIPAGVIGENHKLG